ncbi:predicted protein [Uncinocarpus reesii 1704]|uniref:Cytochrome P450 n=1 Tax=Uncinocarpus reesii (strain UAMH 1704) TaxID=336963 RepID=C4JI34_UNCRE|nr:uncharacterized protein UREG_01459 [Uncinocarpus reesii 1704]EEP76610.1 predicted protein [Uncinocarpus reesii 1704]
MALFGNTTFLVGGVALLIYAVIATPVPTLLESLALIDVHSYAQGPLVRVGPNYVVCSDPSEIRRIWSVHSGYYRSSWYKAIRVDPTRNSVLTICENKAHHRVRGYLVGGYAGKGINNQEQLVDEQVEKLISLIRRKYISTRSALQPLKMDQTMQYLTQDVITAVGFGKPTGYLDADNDIFGLFKTFQSTILPFHLLAMMPAVVDFLQTYIMKPFVPKPTDTHGVGKLLGVIKAHVDTRYEPERVRNDDVLQTFVDSGLTRSEVEVEALVQLLSGTDTTATALRNIIFYVCTNPSAYHALQAEIDIAAETATRPVIADQHAKSLPYLQACIKETLRLWPPIMGLMPKTSDKDDEICGIRVPAKTQVAWVPLAMMKDRTVFGEDACVFEPRRWIDAQPARLREMEATHGLVFATGSRWECLGKRLAYMEMGKTIFEVGTYFLAPFSLFTD